MIKILVLSLTLLITACGGNNDSSAMPSERIIEEITSSITDMSYRVDIYLPENYQSADVSYPVIYSTDGQWRSEEYASYLKEYDAEVILVSIYEGPEDRRTIDFLTPGVFEYFQFFTQELIPFIESTYNASPENRTLIGHSYGGAMVAVSMLIEESSNQYFSNYVMGDLGILDIETLIEIENERYLQSTTLNATAIMTGATIGGNALFTEELYNSMKQRNYQGLNMHYENQEVTHGESALETFKFTLKVLYPKN